MTNRIEPMRSRLPRQALRVVKVVSTALAKGLGGQLAKAETALGEVLGIREHATAAVLLEARRSGVPRVLFAIDATESRKDMWAKAQVAQRSLFEIADGDVAVQLGYFSGNRFYSGSWTHEAAVLAGEMERVECQQGFTQIADVLRHAWKLATEPAGLAALVYVGDHVEAGDKRLALQARWLRQIGVRGFFFQDKAGCSCGFCHLNLPAGEEFMRQYAAAMHGVFYPLDKDSGATLAGLLKAVAAFSTGGHQALATMAASGGHQSALAREVAYQLKRES